MRILLPIIVALAAHAAVLDRIAVTVGRQVIAESDVLRDLRVAAFLDDKELSFTPELKRKAADRLVDQVLILQEATLSRIALADMDDAKKALDQIRQAAFANEAEYKAALARYGITEQDVLNHLLAGLRAMRFTDLRFRPEVQLTDADLHDEYDRRVVEWQKSGRKDIPSFEAVREQVEKLATDERTAQSLDRWLGAQRAETQILYRDQVFQ